MNTTTFFQTIADFDNGYNEYNLGDNWSFLFNQKWYPSRAFMVRYMNNMNEQGAKDMNLHRAVFELSKVLPIYSKLVHYSNHQPVDF